MAACEEGVLTIPAYNLSQVHMWASLSPAEAVRRDEFFHDAVHKGTIHKIRRPDAPATQRAEAIFELEGLVPLARAC